MDAHTQRIRSYMHKEIKTTTTTHHPSSSPEVMLSHSSIRGACLAEQAEIKTPSHPDTAGRPDRTSSLSAPQGPSPNGALICVYQARDEVHTRVPQGVRAFDSHLFMLHAVSPCNSQWTTLGRGWSMAGDTEGNAALGGGSSERQARVTMTDVCQACVIWIAINWSELSATRFTCNERRVMDIFNVIAWNHNTDFAVFYLIMILEDVVRPPESLYFVFQSCTAWWLDYYSRW